jgi:AraC family transcriptional regulator, arabinose operon regulatory protein
MQLSTNGLINEGPDVHLTDMIGSVFDEDESYRVYRRLGASTWLMFLTIGGEGLVRSSKSELVSRPGSVFLLEPGMMHEYQTSPETGRWAFAWIHFWPRPHWRPLLDWRPIAGGIRELPVPLPHPESSPELALWRTMVSLITERGWLSQAEGMATLELILISLCKRIGPQGASLGDPRMEKAVQFISHNLSKPIGVKSIAAECGLSASRLTELFREATGSSPRDYIERERVFKARHLLASTRMPIREVARRSGFGSEFYFSSRFKRLSGVSPSLYRQEKQGLAASGPLPPTAEFGREPGKGPHA